ncbi:hypothetical protein ACFO0N_01895 [Halobium salinum]|uniref:Helix-turn-helix domain-containing protein n=1 Tax=Halobium salinum TaxID=1364940 RepID=A0ABD5P7I0_9EURY|nr:hypothetical protein [Halobium salinum]
MQREGTTSAPERATETVGGRAADAFAKLGNEIRLTILLTLWEAYEPFTDDDGLTFTELRERVGVTDSGRFNYHLEQVTGEFVEETDTGYALHGAGHKVVRAVVAGVGVDDPELDTEGVEIPCPHCGSPEVVDYEDRKLWAVCPDCGPDGEELTLMETDFDPAGVAGRTAAEVVRANGTQEVQKNAMRLAGVCPECSGVVDSRFEVCDDHRDGDRACPNCGRVSRVLVRFECSVCKNEMQGPATVAAASHPTGQSFALEHGLERGFGADEVPLERLVELEESMDYDHAVVSTDPLRVRTTLRHEDGDELAFVFDENVDVVETTRQRRA